MGLVIKYTLLSLELFSLQLVHLPTLKIDAIHTKVWQLIITRGLVADLEGPDIRKIQWLTGRLGLLQIGACYSTYVLLHCFCVVCNQIGHKKIKGIFLNTLSKYKRSFGT